MNNATINATATMTTLWDSTTTSSSSRSSIAFGSHHVSSTVSRLLEESPVFLSRSFILSHVLPVVIMTMLVVTLLYVGIAFPSAGYLVRTLPAASSNDTPNNKDNLNKKKHTETNLAEQRKLAYQMTNCVTNACIGCLGLYFQYVFLPSAMGQKEQGSASSSNNNNHDEHITMEITQKVQGLLPVFSLGAVQIGFQIWSIVMGLWIVPETTQMLCHHVAVIVASFKGSLLTNGFRYYVPMGLGMTELSSVPLSVMNAFKDHATWRESWPQYYTASRLVFSALFLVVRIGLFVPQHVEYLKLSVIATYASMALSSKNTSSQGGLGWWTYIVFSGLECLGCAFLLILQLMWGLLIAKAIMKMVTPKVSVRLTGSVHKKTD